MDNEKGVYLTVPADGAYESRPYPGSGQSVAQAVAAAFSQSAKRVYIAEKTLTKDQAMESARVLDAAYLVILVISHWEQRATEWSGRPSRMQIRISIYDTNTGVLIDSANIEGRSRIVSFTATSPESLLRNPVKRYVDGLYKR